MLACWQLLSMRDLILQFVCKDQMLAKKVSLFRSTKLPRARPLSRPWHIDIHQCAERKPAKNNKITKSQSSNEKLNRLPVNPMAHVKSGGGPREGPGEGGGQGGPKRGLGSGVRV